MGIAPRRVEGAFTRRDFFAVCGSASTLLLPAPLFGAVGTPLAREAPTPAAAATSLFPDYRILPQYRTLSPLAELIRKARHNYPEVLNNLSVLFLLQGRTAEAQEQFQKAIHVAADFDQAYLNLARLYMMQGEKTQAREILLEWLARHPEHAVAKGMLEKLGQ
jgi:tetratricopeptide (TPR) repeat protein